MLLFLYISLLLLAISGRTKLLYLRAAAGPIDQKANPSVDINLLFFNATAPPCEQISLEKLCFPDQDMNFHIKENRMPGALRQLGCFTLADVCPDYNISYSLDLGTIHHWHGHYCTTTLIHEWLAPGVPIVACVHIFIKSKHAATSVVLYNITTKPLCRRNHFKQQRALFLFTNYMPN